MGLLEKEREAFQEATDAVRASVHDASESAKQSVAQASEVIRDSSKLLMITTGIAVLIATIALVVAASTKARG